MNVIDAKIVWVVAIARIVKIAKIVIVALMCTIRKTNNILLVIINAKIMKNIDKSVMKKKSDALQLSNIRIMPSTLYIAAFLKKAAE